MSRSLKKGPYIDFRLENKVEVMNDSGKEISDQNMVKKINDLSRIL